MPGGDAYVPFRWGCRESPAAVPLLSGVPSQLSTSTLTASFAPHLEPPYYAVLFTSLRTATDAGYGAIAERMAQLASSQPGCLGVESVRGPDGFGITLSYWETPASFQAWKENAEHMAAQETGRRQWYQHDELRVARVERAYAGPAETLHPAAWDVG